MQAHIKVLHEAVQKFCLEEKFSDVLLSSNIDNKTVPAHSLVLAAYSTYFREECMNYRQLDDPFVVHLDIKSDILRNLVDYCYTGNAKIEEGNVIELLTAALLFKFVVVAQACEKYLITNLSTSNCLDVVAYAEKKECKDLLEQAEVYLFDNIVLISETEEFLRLSLKQLQNILAKNRRNSCEEHVFNSVIRWVEENQRANEEYLPKLLPKIRIKCLKTDFVSTKLALIRLCAEALRDAQEMLMEECTSMEENLVGSGPAQTPSLEDAQKDELKSNRKRIEKFNNMLFIIGSQQGFDQTTEDSLAPMQIARFDVEHKRWLKHGEIDGSSFNSGAVYVNQLLIIVGGISNREAKRDVFERSLVWCAYKDMTFMQTGRASPAVTLMNNCVYAIGGANSLDVAMNTVERLDLSSRNWEYVANLNEARKGAGVAILDGILYVVGGSYQGKPLRTVERYDVAANKWINCQPMTKERHHHGVATFKEYIYAVGGRDCNADCLNSVERYDPLKDEWTKVCDLKNARADLSCISFENQLYAIGGRFDGTVETYDAAIDEWQMHSHLCDFYSSCIALTTCESLT